MGTASLLGDAPLPSLAPGALSACCDLGKACCSCTHSCFLKLEEARGVRGCPAQSGPSWSG